MVMLDQYKDNRWDQTHIWKDWLTGAVDFIIRMIEKSGFKDIKL